MSEARRSVGKNTPHNVLMRHPLSIRCNAPNSAFNGCKQTNDDLCCDYEPRTSCRRRHLC